MSTMTRLLLLLSVAVSGAAFALPPPPEVYPPLPAGEAEHTASCVYPEGTPHEQICEWSISIRTDTSGTPIAVLGSRQMPLQPGGVRWTVYDRIPHPPLRRDQTLVVALCQRDGKDDPFVVARVRTADSEWLPAVGWAARFDTALGRFAPIEARGVRCLNDGYGL